METALNEISLVLFTTIAPAGVIGYLIMAFAIVRTHNKARANTISHYLVIPLALVILGLIASATHLGTPANALYVLSGIGRSPLSNEVVAAVIFLALGGIYWIISFRDDLTRTFRLAWLTITAVAGLVFIGFIALAYSVPSIPTWNLPTTPITLWFNALSSGPVIGLTGLLLAREEPCVYATIIVIAIAICATVANTMTLAEEWQSLSAISTTVTRAVDLVPLMPYAIALYAFCETTALTIGGIATLSRMSGTGADPFTAVQRSRTIRLALMISGSVLALAGCFAVRFSFYAMHMTLGI